MNEVTINRVGGLSAAAPQGGIVATPCRAATKTIYLIRHGEGYHNAEAQRHSDFQQWRFFDAHLTPAGWAQTQALNAHLIRAKIKPQLVVVSPLRRTLETAAGSFGVLNGPAPRVLMNALNSNAVTVSNESRENQPLEIPCTPHAAIGCPQMPIVALELCREIIGANPCDARRPVTKQQADFPGVNFDLIESNKDNLWQSDRRESEPELTERGRRFAKWLMARPEKEIAVVTHSIFLMGFLQSFGNSYGQELATDMRACFANCELRVVTLADHSGAHLNDAPLNFNPGAPHVPHMPHVRCLWTQMCQGHSAPATLVARLNQTQKVLRFAPLSDDPGKLHYYRGVLFRSSTISPEDKLGFPGDSTFDTGQLLFVRSNTDPSKIGYVKRQYVVDGRMTRMRTLRLVARADVDPTAADGAYLRGHTLAHGECVSCITPGNAAIQVGQDDEMVLVHLSNDSADRQPNYRFGYVRTKFLQLC